LFGFSENERLLSWYLPCLSGLCGYPRTVDTTETHRPRLLRVRAPGGPHRE